MRAAANAMAVELLHEAEAATGGAPAGNGNSAASVAGPLTDAPPTAPPGADWPSAAGADAASALSRAAESAAGANTDAFEARQVAAAVAAATINDPGTANGTNGASGGDKAAAEQQSVEAQARLRQLIEKVSQLRLPRAQLRRLLDDETLQRPLRQVAGAIPGILREDMHPEQRRGLVRLQKVLETYTDVCRYPLPQRPDAAVFVAAANDAYVSMRSVLEMHSYWKGSGLRVVSGGHVSAFLMHQDAFRGAMLESLARLKRAEPLK